MTQHRRSTYVYWLTCDGSGDSCWGGLPELYDDGHDSVLDPTELDVGLDLGEWLTVVRYGQVFHYCPDCAHLLCPSCERWVGDEQVPDAVCVFCRVRAGGRPRILAYFPRLLFLPDSPLTVPTMVEALSVDIDASSLTVPGSAPALPGAAWGHGMHAEQVSLPADTPVENVPTLPEQEPIRTPGPSRTISWKQVAGWSGAFLAAILIWFVAAVLVFGWPG